MPIRLLVGPPATGKTTACVARVRQVLAERPLVPVWVVVPDRVQTRYFRRRLAEAGGAFGARVGTFGDVYHAVLDRAGETVPVATAPIVQQIVRAAVDDVLAAGGLAHFAPIARAPGFVAAVATRIAELKRARLEPEALLDAAGGDVRLTEIGRIYRAYQQRLLDLGWADPEGLGWLATLALERDPGVLADWALVAVDGFDSFVGAQLDALAALGRSVGDVLVTLPGAGSRPGEGPRKAHRRFASALDEVRARIEGRAGLVLDVERLGRAPDLPPPLAHLERVLFETGVPPIPLSGGLDLVEARSPAEEAREALRWIKGQAVRHGVPLDRLAVVTPEPERYRPFLREAAAEFGLPLRFTEGEPLVTTPPVTALVDLLALPLQDFPRRLTIEAVRTPYFDLTGFGLDRRHADALEAASRAGQVIGGLDQWIEALGRLAGGEPGEEGNADEDESLPALPRGEAAVALAHGLTGLAGALVPGGTSLPQRTVGAWVRWLEDLLDALGFMSIVPVAATDGRVGTDRDGSADPSVWSDAVADKDDAEDGPPVPPDTSLPDDAAEDEPPPPPLEHDRRDRAVLDALREALRALVLVETLVGPRTLDYAGFVGELRGVLETVTFLPRVDWREARVLVAKVLEARGPRFDAVAMVGLSEGVFPQVEREDPLLDEDTRKRLGLEPRLGREQRGLFYLVATRADQALLLTRPYLAEGGQAWDPSPYWRAVCEAFGPHPPTHSPADAGEGEVLEVLPSGGPDHDQVVLAPPSPAPAGEGGRGGEAPPGTTTRQCLVRRLRGDDPRPVADAASGEELLFWSVRRQRLPKDAEAAIGSRWVALRHARYVLAYREADPDGPHEGVVPGLAAVMRERFAPTYVWSASRLEQYGTCPFRFYVETALELAADAPPAPGLDAAQLGSLLHHILEVAYATAADPRDPESVLAALRPVAAAEMAAAPEVFGFRATAWWSAEQSGLLRRLEETVRGLAELPGEWIPVAQEARFGLGDQDPLVLPTAAGDVRVRGIIDRVDDDGAGNVRVLDYKTGSGHLAGRDLVDGVRLQLPLYALAAGDALGLGEPVEGLYWAILAAKAGSLRLSTFKAESSDGAPAGVDVAVAVARAHVGRIVSGVRAADFRPRPPRGGCPAYCGAADWCWRFHPGRRG